MASNRRTELNERWRDRIKAGLLMKRLRDHALNKVEMSSTQIAAARILLNKCIPDLSSIEHSGEVTQRHVSEIPDAELASIAAGGRAGVTEAASGEKESPPIH